MTSQGRSVILALCIVLLQPTGIFAIPADVYLIPDRHESAWGLQYNSILQRDFSKLEGEGQTTQGFLQASYGLTDRLLLDGKIGMGSVRFERADGVTLDFPAGFAGGYGFRYLFREPQAKQQILAGFQHISCHPLKDTVNDVDYRAIWDEWQGTLIVRHSWKKISVYAGPQYTALQLKYKENDSGSRLKADNSWGGCVGAEYSWSDRAAVNMGLRGGAELGFDLGLRYLF